MCRNECWVVNYRAIKSKLDVTDMRMVLLVSGFTRRHRISNTSIREKVVVARPVETMRVLLAVVCTCISPVEAPIVRVAQMKDNVMH